MVCFLSGVSNNWIRKMLHQAAKDSGMDIRYIQVLLGHKELTTTEIYTRISNKELVKTYRLSHPSA